PLRGQRSRRDRVAPTDRTLPQSLATGRSGGLSWRALGSISLRSPTEDFYGLRRFAVNAREPSSHALGVVGDCLVRAVRPGFARPQRIGSPARSAGFASHYAPA